MIKIFETNYYNEDIIKLWNNSFGDTREEILFFIHNCVNKSCLCFEYNGRIASMLFLVDGHYNNKKCKYIYAACTDKDYRNNGFMCNLLDYSLRSFENVLIIPANADLAVYYKKHGFTYELDINKFHFDESKEICEYLFDGCETETPVLLSNKPKKSFC